MDANETAESKMEQKILNRQSWMERRFETILLSICTAAVLGMFGFLWSMNARMAVSEERDRTRSMVIDRMQGDLNTLRLDVGELKLKVAQLQVVKDGK